MKLHRDESGQAIILAALAVPCLVAMIGLAVDAGKLFNDRRDVQIAADAAAIAGALNLSNGTYVAAAKAASAANGFTDGTNGTTVTINNGPTWPSSNYKGQTNYIEATVTKSESTVFMAAFGFPTVNVTARAVGTNQAPGNGCVYTLGQTGTDLTVQGSIAINAPDCDFNVDSSSGNAVVETGKAGSNKGPCGTSICTSAVGVVGPINNSKNSYADFSPVPVGNVVPYSDPLASMQYPYTCSSGGCTCPSSSTLCASNPIPTGSMPTTCSAMPSIPSQGTVSLAPGCYDLGGGKGTTIGAQVTLNLVPTTNTQTFFFTDGTLNLQAGATMNALGVTMIFTGTSTINMNGGPTLDITAPTSTSSAFPGILYYQVPADTASLTLGGNASSTIDGVFYAPTAGITFQGTPGGTIYTDFVSSTLTLAGNASFNSYAQLPGGANAGLHAIALVE